MRIGIHDHESNGFPNLALMKISSWHKTNGNTVEWFDSSKEYDLVYSSKVFTWTEFDSSLPGDTIYGGTGTNEKRCLPDEVEKLVPDYELYDCKKSYGFLTRGCIRKCPWCFVPEKEGMIRAHQDIEDFCRHDEVVLLDNNVLAHPHGISQIEKISKMGIKIDFNQGLDARLIDSSIAKLLGKVKWKPSIRLACDSASMIAPVYDAVKLLRWHNATPSQYFCYVLVKDVEDALERVKFLKGIYVYPFCQPYRDKEGNPPTKLQRDFARWCNHRAIFRSTTWENYNNPESL
jgi:hypothetical protein